MRRIERTSRFKRDFKRETKGRHRATLVDDFVDIVTALANDRPLAWAEKGLAAFGEETDSRLISLLAELYHGLNRHDDAVNLVWPQFEQAPSLETYEQLR